MTADAPNILDQRPRLHLFGRFRLAAAGAEMDLPGRKARGILAFLALAPSGSATRDQLADLLWTDRGPEQARASLRQSLKELRDLPCVTDAIVTAQASVSFDEDVLAVDLNEMHRAAAAHDLAALADLHEQAGGDLLEDFLDVAPAFDEWLQAERPRLRDLVLGEAVEAIEAQGPADMRNARRILRSLDRIDPINEAVVRLAMRLDHAAGDGASLHRRYRQLGDLLHREFGAQPSEETRALFHSLTARHDGAAAPSPPAAAVHPPMAHGGDMVPLVVVAPLQAGGPGEALQTLAELCTDDVRVSLSRMRGIHVLAADDKDLGSILSRSEDALGLYLLSGSLRAIGSEVRVNVQLANAASQIILWSESLRFDEAREGGSEALVDDVVAKAAGAVVPAIDRDLDARLRQAAFEIHDERAVYTRARLLIRSGAGLPAVREGVRLLEQVVAGNPQHLGAHLLLARMYNSDFWQQIAGHDVAAFRQTAERHLQHAAGIEPGHYAVRIGRAWRHWRKGEAEAARREFEAVLANMPHDADVTNQCATGLCLLGWLDRAEPLMQRAFFLNPFAPGDYHADYAVLLALKGEHQAAEEHFAVCGECGPMYAAWRLANAVHLAGGEARIGATRETFIADFRRAWQPDRAPALDDAIEWIGLTLPVHPPEHMAWLKDGLRRMLEPCWPATGGSGS